jgi:hypothetical protein
LDSWHPFGALFDKFGYRIIYDSQSSLSARLDAVLRNGSWCWKPARSDLLVAIQSKLPEIPLGAIDKPIWSIAKKGSYVCADTWNFLRKKKEIVDWGSLVWFPNALPKQAFIFWLVMKNRLTMGDRMLGWGYTGDIKCFFCRHYILLKAGTIFSFPVVLHTEYGKFVCNVALRWLLLLIGRLYSVMGVRIGNQSPWRVLYIYRLILSSTVYSIWCARNEIKHHVQPRTEEQILKSIFWEVRTRISGKGCFQKTKESIRLCHCWNVDTRILV